MCTDLSHSVLAERPELLFLFVLLLLIFCFGLWAGIWVEVGFCSFWGAEAVCYKLYEPFKDRTKPCTCCRKIPEVIVIFSSSQLKWGPDTRNRDV